LTKPLKQSGRAGLAASLLLFFVVFALSQIHNFILNEFQPSVLEDYILLLVISSVSLVAFVVFVKSSKSTFKNQGYRQPTIIKTKPCVGLAVLCFAVYMLIYLSPGFSTGLVFFGIRTDLFLLLYRVVSAVIFSFAAESVFRGFIFRNFSRSYGFFTSLYASAFLFGFHQVIIIDLFSLNVGDVGVFIFTNILPVFVQGLFLGFLFYKTGWSLLAPIIFSFGYYYFFNPGVIIAPSGLPWWVDVTFEMAAYIALILIVDYAIKEPAYRRKKYGLED
jgi:membrane protease YdiL (CAAX protease family)